MPVVLFILAIWISLYIAWNDYLLSKEHEHIIDTSIKLSEQETKRLLIITKPRIKQHDC